MVNERSFVGLAVAVAVAVTVFLVWGAIRWHTGWPLLYLYFPVLLVALASLIAREIRRMK